MVMRMPQKLPLRRVASMVIALDELILPEITGG
jgi:hypothetical protein